MALVIFVVEHLALLLLVLACAAGMGTLFARSMPLPLRAALGLGVWAEALFLLAAIGQLKPVPIATLAILSLASIRPAATGNRQLILAALFLPILILALHPPVAFDETLYHLPTIRSLAASAHLRYAAELRFPVFPQLQELLCVPLYLFADDTATHLVSLAEVLITGALLLEWGGWLAAAFFLGSPIVVYLATAGYVDAALTLFVGAAFYCIDRDKPLIAGFLLGVVCSVKYFGGYFAFAGLVYVLLRLRNGAEKNVCAPSAPPSGAQTFLSAPVKF